MVGFYICFIPGLFMALIEQYHFAVSCWFLKVLRFISTLMVALSSTINPVICIAFVQSFRRQFTLIANSCCSKRLTTYNTHKVEKYKREKLTLENVRVTAMREKSRI